jgi:hypothetical protein
MRYGYYIPSQNILRGDKELAAEAEFFYLDILGLDKKHAYHYDGVSVMPDEKGKLFIRVVQQNLFRLLLDNGKSDVKVHDFKYPIEVI